MTDEPINLAEPTEVIEGRHGGKLVPFSATPEGRKLRLIVLALVAGGLVLPILAGLWETTRAAFGILPAIGAVEWSLDSWRRLFALPGFGTSLTLTLWTGFASTALALALAVGFAAVMYDRFGLKGGARLLTPFLATPHAALAIGLAFLIAPSGWIARMISPWATGWDLPPDVGLRTMAKRRRLCPRL